MAEESELDFCSSSFNALRALYTKNLQPPVKNARIYNNINHYANALEPNKPDSATVVPQSDQLSKRLKNIADNKVVSRNRKRDPKKLEHLMKVKSQTEGIIEKVAMLEKSIIKRRQLNVLERMEVKYKEGPMSILYNCIEKKIKLKVWTRKLKGLRGVCVGYLVAFDKHMNLAMMDVDEMFAIEEEVLVDPAECFRIEKRKEKKRNWRRKKREKLRANDLQTSCFDVARKNEPSHLEKEADFAGENVNDNENFKAVADAKNQNLSETKTDEIALQSQEPVDKEPLRVVINNDSLNEKSEKSTDAGTLDHIMKELKQTETELEEAGTLLASDKSTNTYLCKAKATFVLYDEESQDSVVFDKNVNEEMFLETATLHHKIIHNEEETLGRIKCDVGKESGLKDHDTIGEDDDVVGICGTVDKKESHDGIEGAGDANDNDGNEPAGGENDDGVFWEGAGSHDNENSIVVEKEEGELSSSGDEDKPNECGKVKETSLTMTKSATVKQEKRRHSISCTREKRHDTKRKTNCSKGQRIAEKDRRASLDDRARSSTRDLRTKIQVRRQRLLEQDVKRDKTQNKNTDNNLEKDVRTSKTRTSVVKQLVEKDVRSSKKGERKGKQTNLKTLDTKGKESVSDESGFKCERRISFAEKVVKKESRSSTKEGKEGGEIDRASGESRLKRETRLSVGDRADESSPKEDRRKDRIGSRGLEEVKSDKDKAKTNEEKRPSSTKFSASSSSGTRKSKQTLNESPKDSKSETKIKQETISSKESDNKRKVSQTKNSESLTTAKHQSLKVSDSSINKIDVKRESKQLSKSKESEKRKKVSQTKDSGSKTTANHAQSRALDPSRAGNSKPDSNNSSILCTKNSLKNSKEKQCEESLEVRKSDSKTSKAHRPQKVSEINTKKTPKDVEGKSSGSVTKCLPKARTEKISKEDTKRKETKTGSLSDTVKRSARKVDRRTSEKRKREDTPARPRKIRRTNSSQEGVKTKQTMRETAARPRKDTKTNINQGGVKTKEAKFPGKVVNVRVLKVDRGKALVLKKRHVNQLFIRGDNIIMVAYDDL